MTVGIEIPLVRYVYTVPATFAFNFRILQETDLEVNHIDEQGLRTLLVLSTDYTVTINPSSDGGDVIVSYAGTNGFLDIERDIPPTQEADYVNNNPFDMDILERSLDKLTMLVQQIQLAVDQGLVISNFRGTWLTATEYFTNDIVQYPTDNSNYYICGVQHISNVFDDELASAFWIPYIDVESIYTIARAWAVNPEDVLVMDGINPDGYSSFHWSRKAQDWAITPKDTLVDDGFSPPAFSAVHWASKAEDWSSTAEDVPVVDGVNPDGFSAYHWSRKAAFNSGSLDRMRWRGEWQSTDYLLYDTVTDGIWAMVANQPTNERAAPQAVGDPFDYYDGLAPSAPVSVKQILAGQRYTLAQAGWINGYRVYTVTGNSYTVYSVRDPLGSPVITQISSFVASIDGWVNIAITPVIAAAGTVFDLLVLTSEPDLTPTTWNGNWNYDTPQIASVPGVGVMSQANDQSDQLRVHKTDSDAGDRAAELLALTPGDIVESGTGIRWSVQNVFDAGAYVTLTIAPSIQSGADGLRNFIFETIAATPITRVEDVDHWLADADVDGLYIEDGEYANIAVNDNAYGIDITFQPGTISDHWDVLAMSGGSGGSGGASVTVGDIPPLNPADGDLWYDSVVGVLCTWYEDIDSGQWVSDVIEGNPPAQALVLPPAEIFLVDGVWTNPGASLIKVRQVGAGGGGSGNHASSGVSAPQGAGGGYAEAWLDVSAIASATITIGAAGTGGATATSGVAGGTTSYSDGINTITCTGGGGGVYASTSTYENNTAAGIATGGDLNLSGAFGNNSAARQGVAPSSMFGGGGSSAHDNSEAVDAPGYGAGGGAGDGNNTAAREAGSNGGPGILIIEYIQ